MTTGCDDHPAHRRPQGDGLQRRVGVRDNRRRQGTGDEPHQAHRRHRQVVSGDPVAGVPDLRYPGQPGGDAAVEVSLQRVGVHQIRLQPAQQARHPHGVDHRVPDGEDRQPGFDSLLAQVAGARVQLQHLTGDAGLAELAHQRTILGEHHVRVHRARGPGDRGQQPQQRQLRAGKLGSMAEVDDTGPWHIFLSAGTPGAVNPSSQAGPALAAGALCG